MPDLPSETSDTGQTLAEQPIPSETRCPKCGAKPTTESVQRKNLSDLGYLHQDTHLECADEECGGTWVCGVPIGEFDREEMAADLHCDSCAGLMLVHRVVIAAKDRVQLHLKCQSCYAFETTQREVDDEGRTLVGYPQITGQTDGADPYGYTR